MNWKLIFLLSLFGMAMGFATVYGLPSKAEPFVWLPIFLLCAFLIAKNARRKYFLHGFLIGLANCVWVTSIHIRLSVTYLAHHPVESAQYLKMHIQSGATINQCILITGTVAGIISAVVLGLFANVAAGIIKKMI